MSTNHDDLRNRLRSSLDHRVAPELSPDLVSGASGRHAPRLTNPARTLRVAGAAGVLVAAVTVGALVAVPSFTRPPLFTAAATSGDAAALGTAEGISSDQKMMAWVEYRYTAGASLSTDGGSGQVYQLVRDSASPEDRTAELAAIFGVDGSVTKAEYSDAAYPTWVVGPQDGSGSSITVSAFGTGDWWYNDPAAQSIYVCDATVTVDDARTYGCLLPSEAPANLAPTGDEARALAEALFSSTGYESDAADFEIYADDWSTTVNAYLVVDGVRTALNWSASWSNTGDLSYAYGHSISVEARGTFGTVSPTAAVDRLADYRWYGSAGPDFQGGAIAFSTKAEEGGVAVDPETGDAAVSELVDPPTDEPGAGVEPSVDPVEPVDPGTDPGTEPAPEETEPPVIIEPTPEVVEVTVDNATATLLLMWDADGNAWLVPGYAMEMPEGWWSSVVSLVDGVIALPEPFVLEGE